MAAAFESTFAEEMAHAATHGLGAILGVVGMLTMVAVAAEHGTTALWTSIVFCSATVLLYSASTLYHSVPGNHLPRLKEGFRRFDHAAIYTLIAGTYTPFALLTIGGRSGWILFSVIWSLAALGIMWKVFSSKDRTKLSLTLYLIMGWIGILSGKSLFTNLPAAGLWLLLGGGAAYTVGAIFYAWNKLPFNHAIWHLFVLAGTALHYFAILYFVLPVDSGTLAIN